jgi:hypothetical protein
MRRADGYDQETADRYCICNLGPDTDGPDVDCPLHGANPTIRPDDDPAPIPTCDGRNCGGVPHE